MKYIGKYINDSNKYGYIDKNGKVVVDFKYDFASEFSEGLARVKKGEKYGFIDKNGNVVIDFIYDDADNFSDGLARVKQREKDENGKSVEDKEVWKYIDKNGAFDISKCNLIAYSNGGYYSLGKKVGKFGFSVQKKKKQKKK